MKNMMQLMQKAQDLQSNMLKVQKEVEIMTFSTSVGADLLKMSMNGRYDIISIDIDPSILTSEDQSLLSDLLIAAYNDVRRKVKETTEDKMKEVTAGLPIPPGMKIPGLF